MNKKRHSSICWNGSTPPPSATASRAAAKGIDFFVLFVELDKNCKCNPSAGMKGVSGWWRMAFEVLEKAVLYVRW